MSFLISETNNVFEIKALEVHVTHTCNMHCDGCKHYSNYNHKGHLDVAEFKRWIAGWSKTVKPKKFRLLGGEPTLNPQLTDFVYAVHECWPETQIYITTNGHALAKHPHLLDAMIHTNARMSLSIHSNDAEYLKKIEPIRRGMEEYRKTSGIELMETDVTEVWTRNYLGTGHTMKPFNDENPEASWNNCSAKHCMQLHENRLWKCAPIAYLGMQLEKFDLLEDTDWFDYLNYKSLGLEATTEEMRAFFLKDQESICSMCPADPTYIPDKTIKWKGDFKTQPNKVLASGA